MKILKKLRRLVLEDSRQVAGVLAGIAIAALAVRMPTLRPVSGLLLIAGVLAGLFWSLARSLGGRSS